LSLKPGKRIGKYVVIRKLAEGGMAELFLCCFHGPKGFEKEVVVKRIRPPYAKEPAFVDMFISEAKLAARFSHQNLVQIFDFSVDDESFYLVMEYVRGKSLVEVRNHSRQMLVPIPPILVAQIGAQIANGLQHAHELHKGGRPIGVVHRDVTPHNVLLSFDGSVKLTDFGIAKSGDKLTVAGQLKGKFGYMSPEQAEGEKDVDYRSDIFSLGVVLWELLTGGRLFVGDHDMAIVRSVRESVIPNPARLNPDVPEDIDAAVMKALSRNREARFGTAGELGRALAQSVLHHANTVEEHDIAVFLARLFPEEVLAYRSGAPPPEVSASGASTTSSPKTGAEEPSEWISFKSMLNVEVKDRTEAGIGNADTLAGPGEHRDAAAQLLPDRSAATTLASLKEQWIAAADPANRTTLINFNSRPAVVFVRRVVSAIVAALSKTVTSRDSSGRV
jgi:serine/threonine protein kinase